MAKMYPDPIPDYVIADSLRSSEVRVYNELKRQLPDEYTVYYSSPWRGLAPDGSEIDGEVDFLVMHRDVGLMCIEVKGGVVSRDGNTGEWTSRDRHGFDHGIKNPVEQARKGKYAILDKIKALSEPVRKGRHWLRIDYGVILPGSGRVDKDLGADMPNDMFAFGDDMPSLGRWIMNRFDRMRKTRGDAIDGKLYDVIDQLFAASFELKVRLWTEISAENEKIVRLTTEQIRILDDLEINNRLAIPGPAGSGKTLMAIEKAHRLASQGMKTLFLCFNRPLAEHVSRMLEDDSENLDVMTFHQLCYKASARTGKENLFQRDEWPEENEIEGCLLDYIDQSSDARYDAIVVDEGQDFRPEWWELLDLMLIDGEKGILYVFYDDNQKVYSWGGVPAPTLSRSLRLSRNIRNTKSIFKEAARYYRGMVVHASGPEGRPIEEISVPQKTSVEKEIMSRIGVLTKTKGVPLSEISILTMYKEEADRLLGAIAKKYDVRDAAFPPGKHLTVDTVRRYKGLENGVVIVVQYEPWDDVLSYIASTRARGHIVILRTF